MTFVGSLPWQLTDEQRENMVKDFMREQFLRKGVAAQGDIHRPDREGDDWNYHVHMLSSVRMVSADGLGKRVFTFEDKEKDLARWRQAWAERGARELEKQGLKLEAERWRYGHLTNEQPREKALERGDMEWAEKKAQEATHHLGPTANAMERRGEKSDRGNLNRAVQEVNSLKREIHAIDRAIGEEKEKLANPPKTPEDALERGAAMADALSRGRRAANKARDPLEHDGYRLWQRAASRQRSAYDAGAAWRKYWREHVLGERQQMQEKEGELERWAKTPVMGHAAETSPAGGLRPESALTAETPPSLLFPADRVYVPYDTRTRPETLILLTAICPRRARPTTSFAITALTSTTGSS